MKPQPPIYLPLRIPLDKQRLLEEAFSVPNSLFVQQKTFWPGGSFETALERFQGLLIGTEELNRAAPRLYVEGDRVESVEGSVQLLRGVNLTHVPGIEESLHQVVKFDGQRFHRLRLECATQWTLRHDLVVPHIHELLTRLPFHHLSVVRLIVYEPGAFVPTHVDEPNGDYRDLGYMQINIILADGGTDMIFRADGVNHVARENVFAFDFSYPHGVPPAKDRRVVICAEGLMDWEKARPLADWEQRVESQTAMSFGSHENADGIPATVSVSAKFADGALLERAPLDQENFDRGPDLRE